MSRKHHVKKLGGRSNYKQRLTDRGLRRTPEMRSLSELRRGLSKEEQQIIADRENSQIRRGGTHAR